MVIGITLVLMYLYPDELYVKWWTHFVFHECNGNFIQDNAVRLMNNQIHPRPFMCIVQIICLGKQDCKKYWFVKYSGNPLRMNEHLEVYFSIILEEHGEIPLAAEDLRIIYEITQQAQFTVKHLEWKEQYGSGKKKVVILSRNNMF